MKRKSRPIFFLILGTILIAAATGFFYVNFSGSREQSPSYSVNDGKSGKKSEAPPKNAQIGTGYSVSPVAYESGTEGTRITLRFDLIGKEQSAPPAYRIENFPDQAKTMIVFDDVNAIKTELDYKDVASDPQIDSIDYYIENDKLIINLSRKGAYLPVEILKDGSYAIIYLKAGMKTILRSRTSARLTIQPLFRASGRSVFRRR
jgi:hypothetical protein